MKPPVNHACAVAACLLLLAGCDFDGVTETRQPAAETAALLGWGEVIPDVEITPGTAPRGGSREDRDQPQGAAGITRSSPAARPSSRAS